MEHYETQLAEFRIKLAAAEEIDDDHQIAKYKGHIKDYEMMQSQVQ